MHRLLGEDLLLEDFECPLALLELSLCILQLGLEVGILLFQIIEGLLHVTSFLLAFASALSGALAVFEQSVLVRWQKFPHADELLLAHELDVDREVSNLDDVSFLELVVDVRKGTPQVFLGLIARFVIGDPFW